MVLILRSRWMEVKRWMELYMLIPGLYMVHSARCSKMQNA